MLDEKELAPVSLVDAVIHQSNLSQRPSQTKMESTRSQPTATNSAGEEGAKKDSAGTTCHDYRMLMLYACTLRFMRSHACIHL